MQDVVNESSKCLRATLQRQKPYVDSKRHEISYDMGTQILLSTTNIQLKTPWGTKLFPKWIGPTIIMAKGDVIVYKLELPNTLKSITFVTYHFKNLRHQMAKYCTTLATTNPKQPWHILWSGMSFFSHKVRGQPSWPKKSCSSSGLVMDLNITLWNYRRT